MDSKNTKKSILVLGIGNLLLKDEGIGVHVILKMQKMPPLPDVELVDGGTSGFDLIDILADRDKVIVVDAMDARQKPATIWRFTDIDSGSHTSPTISLHDFGLAETLEMTRLLNAYPKEIVFLGIQPKIIEFGTELSAEIRETIPRIIDLIHLEIAN